VRFHPIATQLPSHQHVLLLAAAQHLSVQVSYTLLHKPQQRLDPAVCFYDNIAAHYTRTRAVAVHEQTFMTRWPASELLLQPHHLYDWSISICALRYVLNVHH
jgi:hypothetical protein